MFWLIIFYPMNIYIIEDLKKNIKLFSVENEKVTHEIKNVFIYFRKKRHA